jgi:hypothetical protein
MQTFLPFEDFNLTARVLDRQRLGKQRVECKQIFRALHNGGGWANHPAVRMWRGHSYTLLRYYYAIVGEWKFRGYKHEMMLDTFALTMAGAEPEPPYWLGTFQLHARYRAMLVYKNPEHYRPIFRSMGYEGHYQEVDIPGYYWPKPTSEVFCPYRA